MNPQYSREQGLMYSSKTIEWKPSVSPVNNEPDFAKLTVPSVKHPGGPSRRVHAIKCSPTCTYCSVLHHKSKKYQSCVSKTVNCGVWYKYQTQSV